MNNFIVAGLGTGPVGLVKYLFGKGDSNEHENQRIIAAAPSLGIADGTRLDHQADAEQIYELGRDLDSHRQLLGAPGGEGFVWHCAISLPGGEHGERLSDERWAQVARAAIAELGFDGDYEGGPGRAGCRWIAVHHGLSAGQNGEPGNDHIHLAVNIIREDGTRASTWNDRVKMSRVCARFEREFGLSVVTGRAGRGMPGYSKAEAERAVRQHGPHAEPDTRTLARTVRACAAATDSEASFVAAAQAAGLLVRPRYAKGGQHKVIGYSVARRPPKGSKDKPVWYGGGRLAADLTLPKLRQTWPAGRTATDRYQLHVDALAAWGAPNPDQTPQGDRRSYRADAWDQAAEKVAELRQQLAAVPVEDTAAWASTARGASAILAILSARIEVERPGPLAQASDVLARSAQTSAGQARVSRAHGLINLRGVAMVALTAGRDGQARWLILLKQIIMLTKALHDLHIARQEMRQAQAIAQAARDKLTDLYQTQAALAGPARLAAQDFPTGRPDLSRPGLGLPYHRRIPPHRQPGQGHDFGR